MIEWVQGWLPPESFPHRHCCPAAADCCCCCWYFWPRLAKEGAIVARISAVEEMAGMDILCSDKTGETAVIGVGHDG